MASRRTPSTGALESFCEFFSCMQLEYCLREPLSKFEGLRTFYCNFINVNILYCIYGTYGPFLLYVYTTVRIICLLQKLALAIYCKFWDNNNYYTFMRELTELAL